MESEVTGWVRVEGSVRLEGEALLQANVLGVVDQKDGWILKGVDKGEAVKIWGLKFIFFKLK